VDLYITTDIRTMIAIWFGKLAWDAGVRSGRVEVTGPRPLRERLRSWFLLSAIRVTSDVATQSPAMKHTTTNDTAERRMAR
jgi:hypothetical protein